MRKLSDAELVTTWERGRHVNPVRRALLLAQLACPDVDGEALRHWPLGKRDAQLFALRAENVGEQISCLVECPTCRTTLELARHQAALRTSLPDCESTVSREMRVGGRTFELRAPTSDVAELAWNAGDLDAAERCLRTECVRLVEKADDAPTLDAQQWAQLEEGLRQMDAWTDVSFDVLCAECGHEWQAAFDVATFLWEELAQRARRLLDQVHRLARAYGWSEAEILALGAARRHSYVERLNSERLESA